MISRRQIIKLLKSGHDLFASGELLGYPLKVRFHPQKGLHLIASRKIYKDEIILKECPIAMALEEKYAADYCGVCASKLTMVETAIWLSRETNDPMSILCEGCSANNYLVKMSNALKTLRIEIKLRNKTGESDVSTSTRESGLYRNFFRLFLDYAGARLNQLDEDVVCLSMEYAALLDANSSFIQNENDLVSVARAIKTLSKEVKTLSSLSETEILQLCRNLTCNEHVLMSVDGDEIGRALCPVAALFNHACEPNVHWELGPETETLMVCTALEDIPAGAELTIAYLNPQQLKTLTKKRRKELIHATRKFTCQCSSCK